MDFMWQMYCNGHQCQTLREMMGYSALDLPKELSRGQRRAG